MNPKNGQTSRSRRERLKEKTAGQRVASIHREVHSSVLLGNKSKPSLLADKTPYAGSGGKESVGMHRTMC